MTACSEASARTRTACTLWTLQAAVDLCTEACWETSLGLPTPAPPTLSTRMPLVGLSLQLLTRLPHADGCSVCVHATAALVAAIEPVLVLQTCTRETGTESRHESGRRAR